MAPDDVHDKQHGCELFHRATRKPVKRAATHWQVGTYDVTPSSAQNEFAEYNVRAAHADAVAKALAIFTRDYVCIGSCGEERLCILRVKVLKSESPEVVDRVVPTPEGSIQRERLGVTEVNQRLLTLRLQVTCECACISVAPSPLPSGPASVHIFTTAPPIVAPPLPPTIGLGIGGGDKGQGWSAGIGAGWDIVPKIPTPPGYGQ